MNKGRLIVIIILFSYLSLNSWAAAPNIDIKQFTDLRMQYSQRADFDPGWDLGDSRKAVLKAKQEGKLDEAIALSKQWLEKHPIDAEMHLIRSNMLRAKGDFKGFFYHYFMYEGLLASITSSGDGLSKETAMKVTSVAEEYFVIYALHGKLIKQSLVEDKSGIFDEMKCEIDGKEIILYFDVSIPIQATERLLNTKKE